MVNDTEVELKFKLETNLFFKIKERMKQIAKFVKVSEQTDDYFTPAHRNFVDRKFPFEWLRIRKVGETGILNYKHFYPENAEVNTHCDEFETRVENVGQLEKILSILNFRKLVTIENKREIYMYNDEFEISLDSIKDLGQFIEIETKKNFGSVDKAREKLFEFAESLGIDVSKFDKRGYPYLMMENKGLIK